MKFRIMATSCGGGDDLLTTFPFLKDRVKKEQVMVSFISFGGRVEYIPDEKCFIEIATLEELMKLIKMCDNDIILLNDDVPTIEIYDSFRE